MDKKLREAQLKAIEAFSKKAKHFALCGGTALELYYLKHRFSVDLDFFSPVFDTAEIEKIVAGFKSAFKKKVNLESEFSLSDRARVRFYTIPVAGASRPLKIDFAEDVLLKKPEVRRIKGVPVYSAKAIYYQKICTVTGTSPVFDEIGRQVMKGRRAAKDVYDIYLLSKKILPLHIFLKGLSGQLQRGMVHWYRIFSRQELKLDLLDLDIYDKKFNSQDMISYLEEEIKSFVNEVML